MKNFSTAGDTYDVSILRSYLQLILALSSKEKQLQIDLSERETSQIDGITSFQDLLSEHFMERKDVAFYADKLGLTVNFFSKKIKRCFGKSPSKLIQERVVLESKKLLHLNGTYIYSYGLGTVIIIIYLSGAGRLVLKDIIMVAGGFMIASDSAKRVWNQD